MVPPTHHHPDFSHDQKEQEVSAGGEEKWEEGNGRSRTKAGSGERQMRRWGEKDVHKGRKGKGEGTKVVNGKG